MNFYGINRIRSSDEIIHEMRDRKYGPLFAAGKDPLPDHLKPFGGVRPLYCFDDLEFFSWTAV